MSAALSAFRDRKLLFAVLLAVLAANAVVLVSYRTFYDERLRALVSEEGALEQKRDAARARAAAAAAEERKLFETQESLTSFFSDALGKREERVAPLIEEIYATTRAAGLRPDAISYASMDEPGTDALTMTFSVAGPYRDVKRLLSSFERSKRFLVVDQLSLSSGSQDDPDLVNVAFTLTAYFRPGSLRPIRAVREVRSGPRAAASPRRQGAAR